MFERVPKRCNVCNKKIIITNSQVVFGKLHGTEQYFYCNYCGAWALAKWNEQEQLFEAKSPLATKKMRFIQKEILQNIETECTTDVPVEQHKYLREYAYKVIANHLNIKESECFITTMNINQLYKVQTIMKNFWSPFISEKRRIQCIYKTGDYEITEEKRKLTDEELEEIRKQADYILRGKTKYQRKEH